MQEYRRTASVGIACVLALSAACRDAPPQLASADCRADVEVEARIAEAWRLHEQGHLASDRFVAASIYTDDVWFRWDNGREHHMALWRQQPDETWKLSRGAGSALPEGAIGDCWHSR